MQPVGGCQPEPEAAPAASGLTFPLLSPRDLADLPEPSWLIDGLLGELERRAPKEAPEAEPL